MYNYCLQFFLFIPLYGKYLEILVCAQFVLGSWISLQNIWLNIHTYQLVRNRHIIMFIYLDLACCPCVSTLLVLCVGTLRATRNLSCISKHKWPYVCYYQYNLLN